MKGWILIIILLVGIGLGVAGALLGPQYLKPYLPRSLGAGGEEIEGRVRAKQLMQDRLLLTVLTPKGAVLVTFHKKTAEINLLVEDGDMVTLGLHGYMPFVSDPRITRVRKDESAPATGTLPLPMEEPAAAPAEKTVPTEKPASAEKPAPVEKPLPAKAPAETPKTDESGEGASGQPAVPAEPAPSGSGE